MDSRPCAKHDLGVLEWFYMLSEKILFQKSSMVFSLSSLTPRPPVWQKTIKIRGFFRHPSLMRNRAEDWIPIFLTWAWSLKLWENRVDFHLKPQSLWKLSWFSPQTLRKLSWFSPQGLRGTGGLVSAGRCVPACRSTKEVLYFSFQGLQTGV